MLLIKSTVDSRTCGLEPVEIIIKELEVLMVGAIGVDGKSDSIQALYNWEEDGERGTTGIIKECFSMEGAKYSR